MWFQSLALCAKTAIWHLPVIIFCCTKYCNVMHTSYCSSCAYQHSDQYELLWVDYEKWKQSRIELQGQWTTSSNSEVVQGLCIVKCYSYFSSLLGYYFVSVGECVTAFGRIMVPSNWRDKQSKRFLSYEL